MTAEVTQREDGKFEMAYVGEVPWHGNGQALTEDAPIETWQVEAGMDYEVMESPVQFVAGLGMETFKGQKVLYRDDNHLGLGIVSNQYKIVQPGEVLEFFRDLTEASGFKLETAGTLFGGRKYWALARVGGDREIAALDPRDTHKAYLLLSTSADGSMATQGRWTDVRVVCNNTITLALRGKAAVSVTHRSTFDADAAKHELGLTGQDAFEAFAESMDHMRKLARAPLSPQESYSLAVELLTGKDPAKMEKEQLEKALKSKAILAIGGMAATGAGLIGSDLEGGTRTAYAWVNAATQFIDHMRGENTKGGRLNNAWFGDGERIKNRALSLASRMAGIGDALSKSNDTAADPDGFDFRELLSTAAA